MCASSDAMLGLGLGLARRQLKVPSEKPWKLIGLCKASNPQTRLNDASTSGGVDILLY